MEMVRANLLIIQKLRGWKLEGGFKENNKNFLFEYVLPGSGSTGASVAETKTNKKNFFFKSVHFYLI